MTADPSKANAPRFPWLDLGLSLWGGITLVIMIIGHETAWAVTMAVVITLLLVVGDVSRFVSQRLAYYEGLVIERRIQKLRDALTTVARWSSDSAAIHGSVGVRGYAQEVLYDD